MGRYVIAVGGTGSKVLEAIVYAACADAFSTPGEGPLPALDLLSVDVDASCGNTTRLKRAAEAYEEARAALAASPYDHPCFHTRLSISRWSMNLSRRTASVRQMAARHALDGLLARTLFTRAEADLEYSEGFRGHPDLGVLFFADLLGALEDMRAQGQPDELNAMVDRMRADLDRGETVQVLLTGSIFGGTGASGIPAVSRYLRHRFAGDTDRFVMGAVLMLPYYRVPPAGVDTEREIAVSSDEFLDKARTALQYYGMEGMIRDGEQDENGVFDALYLLGLPPEGFVTTCRYSTGSQSQENDAHMLEWLASRCIAKFFRTGFRGEEQHHMDCYYYQLHTPTFCWQSFDQEETLYRRGYGSLLKAAALFFAECYPTLKSCVSLDDRQSARVNYCAPYFAHRPASEREKLEGLLKTLYTFLNFYANWMIQIVRTLPPILCQPAEAEGHLPENDLLDGEGMDELLLLLTQYGLRTEQRSRAEMSRAAEKLQRELHHLVVRRVPDRQTAAKIIAGLGGGQRLGAGAEGAVCSFLATLLRCAGEEEDR